jgi:hypothetical protein
VAVERYFKTEPELDLCLRCRVFDDVDGHFFLFQQNTGEIAQMLWLVIDLLGGT